MSIFDSQQNITGIQLNLLLKHLPTDISFVMGDNCLWFFERIYNHSDDTNNVFILSTFTIACSYFEDIGPVVKKFNENFDRLQVRTDIDKSIPVQIADEMRNYLPQNSRLQIIPTKYFIAFNNTLTNKFKTVYEGYLLRHRCGQKGFETDPEKIGYLHIQFTSDEFDPKSSSDETITLHWFYPFAVAYESK